jgi:hypothetical protein
MDDDKNVINAADRFRGNRGGAVATTQAGQPAKVQSRQEQKTRVEEALSKRKRLDKSDRKQIAANLGRLVAETSPEDQTAACYRIMKHDRSEKAAESLYKKRKRYITLPREAAGAADRDDFAAKGEEFLRLAKAYASLAKSDINDVLFKLVTGTTLDEPDAFADRMAEADPYLQSALSDLEKQVIGKEPYSARMAFAQEHGWSFFVRDGRPILLGPAPGDQYRPEHTSVFAPRITLGHVCAFAMIETSEFCNLLDATGSDKEISDDLRRMLKEHHGASDISKVDWSQGWSNREAVFTELAPVELVVNQNGSLSIIVGADFDDYDDYPYLSFDFNSTKQEQILFEGGYNSPLLSFLKHPPMGTYYNAFSEEAVEFDGPMITLVRPFGAYGDFKEDDYRKAVYEGDKYGPPGPRNPRFYFSGHKLSGLDLHMPFESRANEGRARAFWHTRRYREGEAEIELGPQLAFVPAVKQREDIWVPGEGRMMEILFRNLALPECGDRIDVQLRQQVKERVDLIGQRMKQSLSQFEQAMRDAGWKDQDPS